MEADQVESRSKPCGDGTPVAQPRPLTPSLEGEDMREETPRSSSEPEFSSQGWSLVNSSTGGRSGVNSSRLGRPTEEGLV